MSYETQLIIASWIDQLFIIIWRFIPLSLIAHIFLIFLNSPLNLLLILLIPSLIHDLNKVSDMGLFYISMRFMILPFF